MQIFYSFKNKKPLGVFTTNGTLTVKETSTGFDRFGTKCRLHLCYPKTAQKYRDRVVFDKKLPFLLYFKSPIRILKILAVLISMTVYDMPHSYCMSDVGLIFLFNELMVHTKA